MRVPRVKAVMVLDSGGMKSSCVGSGPRVAAGGDQLREVERAAAAEAARELSLH